MLRPSPAFFTSGLLWLATLALTAAEPDLLAQGRLIYLQHCVICHQAAGQGSPGTFPPLAKSDYLAADRKNGILSIVQGLSGPITVNGQNYNGAMPAFVLDDVQVAAVLTYVRSSWGNTGDAITADEVRNVRKKSRFPTLEKLKAAAAYPPLPAAPAGLAIREVARFSESPVRIASDGRGKVLYVLASSGNVWRLETAIGQFKQIISSLDYAEPKRGEIGTIGLTLDRSNRLYVVLDRRLETAPFMTNEVTIYQSTTTTNGEPAGLTPFFRVNYPWGIGQFNHGVGHIAQGPDGLIYVASGSRTDANEEGKDARFFKGGEVGLTSSIWQVDPAAKRPPGVFARGLRNPYGFCWNNRGEMFATDNGPDADAPEELNFIEQDKHYGFPYQFSNWTNKPYAHTPDAPAGLTFTRPIANLGPDGGFEGKPLYTFGPHTSPAGLVYLGKEFPESLRDSFLVARFGNLIRAPKDIGFDLLQMRLKKNTAGVYEATTHALLPHLGRPIDVHLGAGGKIFIAEYTRLLDNNSGLPMLPGRILELSVKK